VPPVACPGFAVAVDSVVSVVDFAVELAADFAADSAAMSAVEVASDSPAEKDPHDHQTDSPWS